MTHVSDAPFCQRCKEDFPVQDSVGVVHYHHVFSMGELTPMERIPRDSWSRFGLVEWEDENGHYLCGNCYFDLTDD